MVNITNSLNTQIDIVLAILKEGIALKDKCVISKLLPILELYFSIGDSNVEKCPQSQSLQQISEQPGLNIEKDHQFIKKLGPEMLLALSEYVGKCFREFDNFPIMSFLKILNIYLDFDQKLDLETSSKSSLSSVEEKMSTFNNITNTSVYSSVSSKNRQKGEDSNLKHKITTYKKLTFADKNKLLHLVSPFLQNEHLFPYVIPVVAGLNENFIADAISSYAEIVIKDSKRIQDLWDGYEMKKYRDRLSSMAFFNFYFSDSKEIPQTDLAEIISEVTRLLKFFSKLDKYIHFISCGVRYSTPVNKGLFLQKSESRTVLIDENGSNSLIDMMFGDSQNSYSIDISTNSLEIKEKSPGQNMNSSYDFSSPKTSPNLNIPELNNSPGSIMTVGTKLYLTTEMDVEYIGLLCYKCILIIQRIIEALLSHRNHSITTIRLTAKLDQLHGHLMISYSNFAAMFPFLLTDVNIYVLPSEALELTLNAQQNNIGNDIKDILKENKISLTRLRPRCLMLFNPRLYISLVHSTILSLSDVENLEDNKDDSSLEPENNNKHDEKGENMSSKTDSVVEDVIDESKTQQGNKTTPRSILKATESLVFEVSKVFSPTGKDKQEDTWNTTKTNEERENLRVQKIALLKAIIGDNINNAMASTYERFVSIDLDHLISAVVQALKSISGDKKSTSGNRTEDTYILKKCQLGNCYLTATTSSAFLNLSNTVSSIGLIHPQQILSMMLGLVGVSIINSEVFISEQKDIDLSFLNSLTPSILELQSRYPAECIAVNPISRGLELMSLIAYKSVSGDACYSINSNDFFIDSTSPKMIHNSPNDSKISLLIKSRQANFVQMGDICDILEVEKEIKKIFKIPYILAEYIYNVFGHYFKSSSYSSSGTDSSQMSYVKDITDKSASFDRENSLDRKLNKTQNVKQENEKNSIEEVENIDVKTEKRKFNAENAEGARYKRYLHVSKKPQIVITAFIRALQIEKYVSLFARSDENLRGNFLKYYSNVISGAHKEFFSINQSTNSVVFDVPNIFFSINFKISLFLLFTTQISATNIKYKEYILQSVEKQWNILDSVACTENATSLSKLMSTIFSIVLGYVKGLQAIQQLTGSLVSSPILSPQLSSPRPRLRFSKQEIETKQLTKALNNIEQLCKIGCYYCMSMIVNKMMNRKEDLSLVIGHLYNTVVLKLKNVPSAKFFEKIFGGDFSAVKKTKRGATNRKKMSGRARSIENMEKDDDIEDITPPQRKKEVE